MVDQPEVGGRVSSRRRLALQAQVGEWVDTGFLPGVELPFDLRSHLEVGDAFDRTSVLIVTSYIVFRAVATTIKITDPLASCH